MHPQASNIYLFIINPVGSMVQQNQQDNYSFDIILYSVASVLLLTRLHRSPLVLPGQPDHRSTKAGSRLTSGGTSTTDAHASDPRPQDTRHTMDPQQPVCSDYPPGRGHTAVWQHRLGSHSLVVTQCRNSSK